jgi:3-oxoacyl-[acyl-carrier protein] reductase
MSRLDDRLGLDGRTVIVAGAGGGGIGTAVCRLLAEAGVQVAAIDNDPIKLAMAEETLHAADPRYATLLADVRDKAQVDQALTTAADQLGSLHGLVHVVGGLRPDQWSPLLTTSQDTFDEVEALNLRSALLTSQATAAWLIAQGTQGSIVHIASIAGLAAMPFGVAYAAAKAGLIALMRTAAVEWGPRGIRVNAVAPGTIRTRKNEIEGSADHEAEDRAAIPLGRRGQPEDIAGAALFLLSDLASFVSGQVLAVDGASSVKPSYLDRDNLPVFVRNEQLRQRLGLTS